MYVYNIVTKKNNNNTNLWRQTRRVWQKRLCCYFASCPPGRFTSFTSYSTYTSSLRPCPRSICVLHTYVPFIFLLPGCPSRLRPASPFCVLPSVVCVLLLYMYSTDTYMYHKEVCSMAPIIFFADIWYLTYSIVIIIMSKSVNERKRRLTTNTFNGYNKLQNKIWYRYVGTSRTYVWYVDR